MKALVNFFTNEWYFAIPMTLMSLAAFALVFGFVFACDRL